MRTCVIVPCTAEKRGDVPDPALAIDLADPVRRVVAEERLAAYACPAMYMYAGAHHSLVMSGLDAVWERWGRETLDLAILSAGYGLLPANEVIIPYDVSLNEFEGPELDDWLARLRVSERAAELVREYDLAFYLLHGRYLDALGLPLSECQSVQQTVLTAQEDLARVPDSPEFQPIVAHGGRAAQRWHVKAPQVRGFLFQRLCMQVAQHGPEVLEWLSERPQETEKLFYKRAPWRPQYPLW
jgi:hypothetical protein